MEVLPPADQLMNECSMSRHRDAETSRSGIRCITFLRIAHVILFWRTRSDDIGLDQLLSHASIDVEI